MEGTDDPGANLFHVAAKSENGLQLHEVRANDTKPEQRQEDGRRQPANQIPKLTAPFLDSNRSSPPKANNTSQSPEVPASQRKSPPDKWRKPPFVQCYQSKHQNDHNTQNDDQRPSKSSFDTHLGR
jgi:hypothetical protein